MSKTVLSQISKDLQRSECIIEEHFKSFVFAGEELRRIRDDQLYRESDATFEEYVKRRWGSVRSRAYQLIDASSVVSEMSKILDKKTSNAKAETVLLPSIESHAAALRECADDAESRAKVWKAVVEESNGKPTAAAIKKKSNEILPPKINPDKKREPPKTAAKEDPKPVEQPKPEPQPEQKSGFDPEELEAKAKSLIVDTTLPIEGKITQQAKMLEAFCRSIAKFFEDNLPKDPWLDVGQVEIARSQLKSCLSAIRVAKAYEKPCPKCSGKGCKHCRDAGYLPKMSYEMLGGK